ncbi:STAS domain-containing protein [Nocardioides pyridinolyticus]
MHASIALTFDAPDVHMWIDGELDIAYQHRLRNHAADILDCSAGTVDLDLSGITLVDCACLRTLDRLRRELEGAGRGFVITDASLAFGLVAYLAGYDDLLRCIAGSGVQPLRTRRVAGPRPATARAIGSLS